jgi:amino-acid N-acetyltransferase
MIERAQSRDLEPVRRLLSESKLPLEGLEITDLWCAKDRMGRLIGAAGLETWGKQGLLRSVVVDSRNRHAGIGGLLVKRVLGEAKARNLDELYLLTETAPRFFAGFGFRQVAKRTVKGRVLDSVEFREVCPETPPMKLVLR